LWIGDIWQEQIMTRQYNSFLIRCWYLDEREQRIKIEHIQSGEGTVVATLAAALTWLNTRWSKQLDDGPITQELADSAAEEIVPIRETDH
jgi:hypothetical protein